MSNVIDFNAALEEKERAELMAAVEEVRGQLVRNRQSKIIILAHQLLNEEREFGLLTEEEIIEITKVLYSQTSDGLTFA